MSGVTRWGEKKPFKRKCDPSHTHVHSQRQSRWRVTKQSRCQETLFVVQPAASPWLLASAALMCVLTLHRPANLVSHPQPSDSQESETVLEAPVSSLHLEEAHPVSGCFPAVFPFPPLPVLTFSLSFPSSPPCIWPLRQPPGCWRSAKLKR